MQVSVTGRLSVTDDVRLCLDDGECLEVIVLPLQTSMSWEAMVARSVDAFRNHDGKQVTLSGDRHGQILASAILDEAASLRTGTYSGRLESVSGQAVQMELRLDIDGGVLSADFFRAGAYLCSLRARFGDENGKLVATTPRVIFDTDDSSVIGGSLELNRVGTTLQAQLVLPSPLPEIYEGDLSFASPHLRILNIEVDKLDGMPWPPEFQGSAVPSGEQPEGVRDLQISIAEIFGRAGIEARLLFSDGALPPNLGAVSGRPWEADRWDERELHEMMDRSYTRNLDTREWWLYLLTVTRFDGGPDLDQAGNISLDPQGRPLNGGRGTTGIIFDHSTGNIQDPWTPFFRWFEQNQPQFRHLFDFGRTGAHLNSRARQGVAVFWREMLDFAPPQDWERHRWFLRTIIHELGHALNMAHTWLVNRPGSLSFMNYPQRHPSGRQHYWQSFNYEFDAEELFHCHHGFYNEVVPGGRNEFMEWSPTSVFVDPSAGGTRANISLSVMPTQSTFRFTEPVTVEVEVQNHSGTELPIGRLSPSFGNIRFVIRRPNSVVDAYSPPVYKCEVEKERLSADGVKRHLTSLTVGADGFVFDAPGRYELTASMPDPSSGALVIARPSSIWVGYPDADDERIANSIFDRQAGLFLYMAGGEHLNKGRDALEEVAEQFPNHPIAAHANLVLGLNKLAGQKRPFKGDKGEVTKASPAAARPYLTRAARAGKLAEASQRRLEATLKNFVDQDKGKPPAKKKAAGRKKASAKRSSTKSKGKAKR